MNAKQLSDALRSQWELATPEARTDIARQVNALLRGLPLQYPPDKLAVAIAREAVE